MYCISIISTKGGTGKTTLTANLGALMADCGYRILLIDADVQPSLSKYYPIHRYGEHGLIELLLNDQIDERIFSQTVYPNLDIVLSNNITSEIQYHLQSRPDRAALLRARMDLPLLCENYDVVIIDTQGAVGPLQDAAAYAADLLISPIKPDVLSAREFLNGTQQMLSRLALGSRIGLQIPSMKAVIYAMDRTRDAREITTEIRQAFLQLNGKVSLLESVVPAAKAYKEAATRRLPVHCHEVASTGKSQSAWEIMHQLMYEVFPNMYEQGLRGYCFAEGVFDECGQADDVQEALS